MNNKIMARGRDVGGLIRYLAGPGDANEHRDQRVIAAAAVLGLPDGTSLKDQAAVRRLAGMMDSQRRLAGLAPPEGWVWHCAISLPPGESLTDEQWAEVAREAMRRLRFDGHPETGQAGCRWVAVHHGPSGSGDDGNDHIHLAVNLVRSDLSLADPGWDRRAMSRLCADMERRYGLYVVPGRAGRGMPGYTRAAKERAQRAADRAHAQGRPVGRVVPETQTLARKVRACATAATTEAEFLGALAEAGILARPRYGKGDRTQVIGYSVALPARDSGAARPIWYGGGKLAADLTLPKLRARWTTSTPASPATARTTPPDALAAWQHPGDVAASTAPAAARTHVDAAPAASPAGGSAGQWWAAVDHVEAASRKLENLPYENTIAWSRAASDAAALLSLLADRIEGELPADLADAAYTLAWSAQTPRRPHPDAHRHDHHGGARHGGPARDLADVARAVRAASRARGGAEDAAVVVAIAALVLAVLALVALIRAWHAHQQHRRQAAALTEGVGRCEHVARARVGAVAPNWQHRRHGALTDRQLDREAKRAEHHAKELTELEERTAALVTQARAGDGPAAVQLRDRAAALAAAAAAEAALPDASADVNRAVDQHTLARRRVDELAALAERGRVALGLQGTTPARVAADLQTARDAMGAAADSYRAARDRVDDLARQAAAPFAETKTRTAWRPGAATAAHADLTGRWDAHLAAAIADDVRTASQRARGLDDETHRNLRVLAVALPHVVAAEPPSSAGARTALTTIRTEQAIRDALPEHRAAQEQAQRARHVRAQRASRSAAEPSPANPRRHPPPQHGPGRRGGFSR
jgi:hypothetical protein